MRLRGLLVVLLAALLAACARQPARYSQSYAQQGYAQGAYSQAPAQTSELDARMYGAPAEPAAVRRVAQAMPVAATYDDGGGPYALDSGDKLRIVVFGQDALSNNYTVDADGQLALPLIGAVPARGLTTAQLAHAVAARLKQSFIRDPSVAVEIAQYRPFFVLGEVAFPGQYPFVPNMTVEQAIAIAGGFTPRAKRDRVSVTRQMQGASVRLALTPRHPLRPGDAVEVSERWF